jgi:NDP-sugar pyrophosphorylase family protein
MLPVLILSGGLATRLRPITETVPKALVEINGEPFIAHQLRLLHSQGIERAVIACGYLGEMIQSYVGDGRSFGVNVEFSFDGPRLLGTAGAIKKALPMLGEAFYVLYGDSYLPCDYHAVQSEFLRSRRTALMTVYRNDDLWDRSNVEYHDGRIIAYDKQNRTPQMRHIDYGLGVFNKLAFESVPQNQSFDLSKLYRTLLEQGKLAAFEVSQRFYEVGSFEGLEEMRRYFSPHP